MSHGQTGVQPSPGKKEVLLRNKKAIIPNVPSPSFFSQLYMLKAMWYITEYLFGHLGVSCPGCVPVQLPVHPQPSCWGRKGCVKALLSRNYNIPVLSALFPTLILNIVPYQLLWQKSTQHHPKPLHIGKGLLQMGASPSGWENMSLFEVQRHQV